MKFRLAPLLALLVLMPAASAQPLPDREPAGTEWIVRPSPALDAVLLVGILSGDEMQSGIYADLIADVRPQLSEDTLGALDRLDRGMRIERGLLTGPVMANILSAGPTGSLDEIVASARDPQERLRPNLEETPGWDAERTEAIFALMPDMVVALEGLKAFGYGAWYDAHCRPQVEAAAAGMQRQLVPHDVITQQERLVGRGLSPQIEIDLMCFSKPYGISVYGQRFLAHHSYDPQTQLRNAAHEILHPPFDLEDEGLFARLAGLEADPWMRSIVENHDPAFGYNSFQGVVNEDSTQALDQIVSERLGVARDPAARWQRADGGMHMLAAALYHAMKEDGFDQRGGRYEVWLKSALDRGLLAPEEVRRRAGEIVGGDAVQHWYEVAVPEE